MKSKEDKYRQPAKITRVFHGKEDHGILTTSITIDYDNGTTQGFGGLHLGNGKDDKDLLNQYINDLCSTFGVRKIDQLLDKRCFALFSFGRFNEIIEGLESTDTGLRFTHTGWRKNMFGKAETPIEAERRYIEQSIQRAKDEIERDKKKLASLDKEYKVWY